MPRFYPRTIRGQLIVGTALLQCLLVMAVFSYVYYRQRSILRNRTEERLSYQVHMLGSASVLAFRRQDPASMQPILDEMVARRSIQAVRITDLSGRTLAGSSRLQQPADWELSEQEWQKLRASSGAKIFWRGDGDMLAVDKILVDGSPVALAWVHPDNSQDAVDLASLLRSALVFALLAILANGLFSLLVARSVTRPLRGLLRGTKLLIRDPEQTGVFPLRSNSVNEAGELTRAFNTMVAALQEQRSGLNDTLALLDSLLANAPIGFAFFDSRLRYVRLNQFLAEMDGLSMSRHLGRAVQEILPEETAHPLSEAIQQVFTTGMPVRDLELHVELDASPENSRTWVVSFYPVRMLADQTFAAPESLRGDGNFAPVGLVGAVFVDSTSRKLAEEMIRRTEKLAATGRLAASIAHEINNPLEAVTNLLYLLSQQPLDAEARQYTGMAQREIARVAHITQQTLRFYRQTSGPAMTNPAELVDSVLDLYHGRLHAAQVEVIRDYRGAPELMAFSGEMRQLFANLIGNALDAMPKGGRLMVSVRPSRAWNQPEMEGVRIMISDTGSGMTEAVRRRIFEAFFTTKESTGTGLGLWISSEIIRKHQGTIRVRSWPEAEGSHGRSGSVFMLFFPWEGAASYVEEKEKEATEASATGELGATPA